MPRPQYFYYQSVKNLITAFGILFRDVTYDDDFGNAILVPIHYSPKSKFVEMINAHETHDDGYEVEITLPRFGFELTNINYDPGRMLNPMSQIRNLSDSGESYMFNRVPYNFDFTLYLATRKFEDGLKIMEQVIPFFTPDLNISIKDKEDFGITTDVPFTLNDVGFDIDWQGTFETRRSIVWTLEFTAKAWLYSNVREQQRIKETIVKMGNTDFSAVYETLISEVEPRSSDRNDPHTIVDTIVPGEVETVTESARSRTGETLDVELTKADQPIHVREMLIGTEMQLVEFYTVDNTP